MDVSDGMELLAAEQYFFIRQLFPHNQGEEFENQFSLMDVNGENSAVTAFAFVF